MTDSAKRLTTAQRKVLDDATRMLQEWSKREAARILRNPNADGWIRLIEIMEKARKDKRVRTSAGALDFLDLVIDLAGDALTASTADQAIEPLNDVMPLAIHGKAMRQGEKKNPGGPVRKRIAKELAKSPNPAALKPRHLYELIKAKSPKTWEFSGKGRARSIWVTGRKEMHYPWFSQICKEEKDKLLS